jgi:hypothetical protein
MTSTASPLAGHATAPKAPARHASGRREGRAPTAATTAFTDG